MITDKPKQTKNGDNTYIQHENHVLTTAKLQCGRGGDHETKILDITAVACVMHSFSAFAIRLSRDKTGLGGSWNVDIPSEYDLRLGAGSNKGEIRRVTYNLQRPDWFNQGNLAIAYEFSDTPEQDCYDVGYYSVKGKRIDLMGAGTWTIIDDILTICYDDGTVRTFTREQ